MKKLSLTLDNLHVESFATAELQDRKGTVVAHVSLHCTADGYATCDQGYTCVYAQTCMNWPSCYVGCLGVPAEPRHPITDASCGFYISCVYPC